MTSSKYSPKAQIEMANRRTTWVSWQLMTWMLGNGYIPYRVLLDKILAIPHVGSESDAINLIRHMARLTVIDSRSRGNNASYFLTDWGLGLLKAYNARPPDEPTEDTLSRTRLPKETE